jgi:hypothetical protein
MSDRRVEELQAEMHRWRLLHRVGEGSSGETWYVEAADRPTLLGLLKRPCLARGTSLQIESQNSDIRHEISALDTLRNLAYEEEQQQIGGLLRGTVPQILDRGSFHGVDTEYAFLVMSRAAGQRLDSMRIELEKTGKTLPDVVALRALAGFCHVLMKAHLKAVIYNDAQLSHLYWDGQSRVLTVIDWGNARLALDDGRSHDGQTSFREDIRQLHDITQEMFDPRAQRSPAVQRVLEKTRQASELSTSEPTESIPTLRQVCEHVTDALEVLEKEIASTALETFAAIGELSAPDGDQLDSSLRDLEMLDPDQSLDAIKADAERQLWSSVEDAFAQQDWESLREVSQQIGALESTSLSKAEAIAALADLAHRAVQEGRHPTAQRLQRSMQSALEDRKERSLALAYCAGVEETDAWKNTKRLMEAWINDSPSLRMQVGAIYGIFNELLTREKNQTHELREAARRAVQREVSRFEETEARFRDCLDRWGVLPREPSTRAQAYDSIVNVLAETAKVRPALDTDIKPVLERTQVLAELLKEAFAEWESGRLVESFDAFAQVLSSDGFKWPKWRQTACAVADAADWRECLNDPDTLESISPDAVGQWISDRIAQAEDFKNAVGPAEWLEEARHVLLQVETEFRWATDAEEAGRLAEAGKAASRASARAARMPGLATLLDRYERTLREAQVRQPSESRLAATESRALLDFSHDLRLGAHESAREWVGGLADANMSRYCSGLLAAFEAWHEGRFADARGACSRLTGLADLPKDSTDSWYEALDQHTRVLSLMIRALESLEQEGIAAAHGYVRRADAEYGTPPSKGAGVLDHASWGLLRSQLQELDRQDHWLTNAVKRRWSEASRSVPDGLHQVRLALTLVGEAAATWPQPDEAWSVDTLRGIQTKLTDASRRWTDGNHGATDVGTALAVSSAEFAELGDRVAALSDRASQTRQVLEQFLGTYPKADPTQSNIGAGRKALHFWVQLAEEMFPPGDEVLEAARRYRDDFEKVSRKRGDQARESAYHHLSIQYPDHPLAAWMALYEATPGCRERLAAGSRQLAWEALTVAVLCCVIMVLGMVALTVQRHNGWETPTTAVQIPLAPTLLGDWATPSTPPQRPAEPTTTAGADGWEHEEGTQTPSPSGRVATESATTVVPQASEPQRASPTTAASPPKPIELLNAPCGDPAGGATEEGFYRTPAEPGLGKPYHYHLRLPIGSRSLNAPLDDSAWECAVGDSEVVFLEIQFGPALEDPAFRRGDGCGLTFTTDDDTVWRFLLVQSEKEKLEILLEASGGDADSRRIPVPGLTSLAKPHVLRIEYRQGHVLLSVDGEPLGGFELEAKQHDKSFGLSIQGDGDEVHMAVISILVGVQGKPGLGP